MPWQADLPCQDKPVIVSGPIGKYLQCAGHWEYPQGIKATRHTVPIYWKVDKEMLTDDWGFIIPSIIDDPKDFENGKLVCTSCGCYVHRDKRETHREKCNFV